MKIMKAFGTLVAAGALLFALAGTALATVVYATVDGHMAATSDNNNPSWWPTNFDVFPVTSCTSVEDTSLSLGDSGHTYVLTQGYKLVVVKAASVESAGDNSLTLFYNPSAGQTVWADTDGDNAYNPGSPPS